MARVCAGHVWACTGVTVSSGYRIPISRAAAGASVVNVILFTSPSATASRRVASLELPLRAEDGLRCLFGSEIVIDRSHIFDWRYNTIYEIAPAVYFLRLHSSKCLNF